MSANAREPPPEEPPVTREEVERLRNSIANLMLWKTVITEYITSNTTEPREAMTKLTTLYETRRADMNAVMALYKKRAP